jgi:hypothetical protein
MDKKVSRHPKVTKGVVNAAQQRNNRYVMLDGIIPGFGLSVTPTNIKCFILQYGVHWADALRKAIYDDKDGLEF